MSVSGAVSGAVSGSVTGEGECLKMVSAPTTKGSVGVCKGDTGDTGYCGRNQLKTLLLTVNGKWISFPYILGVNRGVYGCIVVYRCV